MKKWWAAFFCLALGACGRNPFQMPQDQDSVLLRLGPVFLTRSELETRMLEVGPEYANYLRTDHGKETVLKAIVKQKLLVRVALDRGLDRESILRQEWDRLRREQQEYLRVYREKLLVETLVDRLRNNELHVTDSEIANYYKEHQKLYHARHILVADKNTADEISENLKKNKATVSAEFTRLARLHSLEAQSAKEGGKILPFMEGELDETFEQAVIKLQPGQASEPVLTSLGLHLIYLEGTSMALFADEIRERCRRILEKKKLQALMARWKEKYVMEVRDDSLRPFLNF